ncbi:MAG: T9SS type A sorting domain-containing protein [Calditrichia bacterium]
MDGSLIRIWVVSILMICATVGWAQQKQISAQQAIDKALTLTTPEVGVNDFRVSDMGPNGNGAFDAFTAAVAYNSLDNEYLVVWSGDDEKNEEFEIWGQRIDAATGEEIGVNDFQISDVGPDEQINFDAFEPAVAYNSVNNEYLVVWYGDDDQGTLVNDELEIFGQLLAADGTELGDDDFRISSMGTDGSLDASALSPDVAFSNDDNMFIVVWHGDDASNGTIDDEFEVFAAAVSAAGNIQNMDDIRLSDMGPDGDENYAGLNAAVSYNSVESEFLVIWEGDDNSGSLTESEFEIFGQRFDASLLSEVGANDFRVSDQGSDGDQSIDANSPAIVFNSIDNEYLVVWQGDSETPPLVNQELEIYGQRLDGTSGIPVGETNFRISDMGPDGQTNYAAINAAVTFNQTTGEYLVVWEGDDDTIPLVDDELEIFGQFLDASGEAFGINDFRISDMGPDGDSGFLAFNPALSYNSANNTFLTVWEGKDLSNTITEIEIYGQQLAATPVAPQGLSAAPEQLEVQLSWNQFSGEIAQFYIYRGVTAGVLTLVDSTSGDNLEYSDLFVNELTQYYYQISALGTNGFEGDRSGEVNAMPLDANAPSAPLGLQADAGNFLIDLNWDANPEVDMAHYTLYRNTEEDFSTAEKIARLSSESLTYRDSSLVGGADFIYWLTAVDISGNQSASSNSASATAMDNIAPSAPQELTAAGDNSLVTLNWLANTESDLAGYKLLRSEESSPATAQDLAIIDKSQTTFNDLRVENGNTYYYWLQAFDFSGNESAFSLSVSVMPFDAAPSQPVFADVIGTDQRVELNWQINPEADLQFYSLYRNDENDPTEATKIGQFDHPGNSYVDEYVENGLVYFYWLVATDMGGNESERSASATAMPQDNVAPSAPENLSANGGSGVVELAWQVNEEEDVQNYIVYRSSSSPIIPTDTIAVVSHPIVMFTDSSAIPETEYYYWVAAVDVNGNESSLSISATAIASPLVGINTLTGVPTAFELYQNFPNPFNPSTTITFDLPTNEVVQLAIYNMLGQVVRILVAEELPAGRVSVTWDGANEFGERLSSGVYLYRIEAGNIVQTRKLVMMK